MVSLASVTGWRKLGDETIVPSRMVILLAVRPVSHGIAACHACSRYRRHARWSYVHRCAYPRASIRRARSTDWVHGSAGKRTTPMRTTLTGSGDAVVSRARCARFVVHTGDRGRVRDADLAFEPVGIAEEQTEDGAEIGDKAVG